MYQNPLHAWGESIETCHWSCHQVIPHSRTGLCFPMPFLCSPASGCACWAKNPVGAEFRNQGQNTDCRCKVFCWVIGAIEVAFLKTAAAGETFRSTSAGLPSLSCFKTFERSCVGFSKNCWKQTWESTGVIEK